MDNKLNQNIIIKWEIFKYLDIDITNNEDQMDKEAT